MDKVVGANLKRMRDANCFSQEQVSKFIGVKRSAYANYESGVREVPLSILESAASLFGCELCLFFEEDANIVDQMLICAFRVDDLSDKDIKEIASFKNIVSNYLKINTLLLK